MASGHRSVSLEKSFFMKSQPPIKIALQVQACPLAWPCACPLSCDRSEPPQNETLNLQPYSAMSDPKPDSLLPLKP